MNEAPDVIVARKIAEELVQRGLLIAGRAARFTEELAAGRVKVEEWKLLADVPQQRAGDEDV